MSDTITGYSAVKLSELTPHPDNPRRGDVEGIMDSIRRFGQVKPLVVQASTQKIVAGNHTAEAIRRLSGSDVYVQVVQVDLSDSEAKAYLIADNRLSDKAGYDDRALIAALQDLQEKSALAGTGYTEDDVDDLLVAIGAIDTPPIEEFHGDYAEPEADTAARWEGRSEGQRTEVVFLLPHADYEQFNGFVEALQQLWSESSKARTIFRAVALAYESTASDSDAPESSQDVPTLS